jgi:hypothetical protein
MDSKHILPLMKSDYSMPTKKKLPILQQMEKQEEKVSSIIMMDKHIFIVLP